MATYTMQLREYIEQATQYDDFLPHRERIEKGRKKLFDFPYPIFNENYRNVFETHFIRKFYFREIGSETEGKFKFDLETWLSINMPYYNKLFESEYIKFDPLNNSKFERLHQKDSELNQNTNTKIGQESLTTGENEMDSKQSNKTTRDSNGKQSNKSKGDSTNKQTNKTEGESTNDSFERNMESNTPDSRLAITTNDGKGVIEYASQIDENTKSDKKTATNTNTINGEQNDLTETDGNFEQKDSSNNEGSASQNETNKSNTNTKQDESRDNESHEVEFFLEKSVGKVGTQTYSKMVQEFRDSFLRIENQIFKEMEQLFMLVY